jgi:hypothetical protein
MLTFGSALQFLGRNRTSGAGIFRLHPYPIQAHDWSTLDRTIVSRM